MGPDPRHNLIGEDKGREIPGFCYPNDHTSFRGVDFSGRKCVLKTSSGTKGLYANKGASHLIAASFCNARATAHYIKQINPETVSFIITNNFKSSEDAACAALICEYIFREYGPVTTPYYDIVNGSRYASETKRNRTNEMQGILNFNAFDFVMVADVVPNGADISHLELKRIAG
tara:strand:+ start:841 stop:1362 length:522 start_codon:yes stop_codon:yes gene_type:complete